MAASAVLGAGLGLGSVRALAAADRPSLPIPPEIRANDQGEINLTARTGFRQWVPAGPTATYGINGEFLGPTVRVNRGDKVTMNVRNTVPQDITMHWHGLEIPGKDDGGPHNIIKPGLTWSPQLTIDQSAATLWYHPHFYPTTAELVLLGLPGLFIIDDEESAGLGLPSTWCLDDIPIIMQDRRFDGEGQFFHRFNMLAITTGYIGDVMLVNGARNPVATTAKGWLRLRLLNGCNARTLRLKLSDDRSFYVVASDSGLLSAPVELKELEIYSGERFEILVDGRDGTPFDLVTLPVTQAGMNLPPFHEALPMATISPTGADGTGKLPDKLVELEPLDPDLPAVSQELVMGMRLDDQGMGLLKAAGLMEMNKSGTFDQAVADKVTKDFIEGPVLTIARQLSANTVNGRSFEMTDVPFSAALGQNLRWLISEGTDNMVHPVHIHGCRFRILALDGKPPPDYLAGWKDMAPISMGGTCEIQVRFNHPASEQTPFMAHCHNLEHEDSGMMTQFSVG